MRFVSEFARAAKNNLMRHEIVQDVVAIGRAIPCLGGSVVCGGVAGVAGAVDLVTIFAAVTSDAGAGRNVATGATLVLTGITYFGGKLAKTLWLAAEREMERDYR